MDAFNSLRESVMHQQDHLLSCQLPRVYTPMFPPVVEGMQLMELEGSKWILFTRHGEWLGTESDWDCLSQSEAFLLLRPGCSNVKPGHDIMLPIKGSANTLSGHLVLALETVHFIWHPVIVVGRKRVLSQDLAATSNSKNTFLSFA